MPFICHPVRGNSNSYFRVVASGTCKTQAPEPDGASSGCLRMCMPRVALPMVLAPLGPRVHAPAHAAVRPWLRGACAPSNNTNTTTTACARALVICMHAPCGSALPPLEHGRIYPRRPGATPRGGSCSEARAGGCQVHVPHGMPHPL